MAYDPNDKDDKRIVDKLIADALAEQQTEHESDITGLKKKNSELIQKLKDADKADPAEIARLQNELELSQKDLGKVTKQLEKVQADKQELAAKAETEAKFNENLIKDNSLSDALVKANVAPHFLDAVKALLAPQVQVKIEGDTRKAVVGDKELAAYVSEWSQGDTGKHYVSAANNGGTGAPGNKVPNNPGGKTLTRSAYEALPIESRGEALSGGVQLIDG